MESYHVQFIELFDGKYRVHRCSILAGRLPGWLWAPLVGTDGHALVGMSVSRNFLEKKKATDEMIQSQLSKILSCSGCYFAGGLVGVYVEALTLTTNSLFCVTSYV